MDDKTMTEGCLKYTYRSKEKRVVRAVLTRSGFTLTLNGDQTWQLSMILKFLFSPELQQRANVPEQYKAFMDGTYQFRENAKLDPDRAKITLDFIPPEMPTFSARQLREIYEDMKALDRRVADDMAMDLGLQ